MRATSELRTAPRPEPARPATALVLAGGGAFAAYEAGVLRYVLDTLPRELGRQPHVDIFAGTSAGALNVSFLAANADDLGGAARRLAEFWRQLRVDRLLAFGLRELGAAARLLAGPPARAPREAQRPPLAPHRPVAGLLDTSPLRQTMAGLIPFDRLQANFRDGRLRGVALCATEICTGTSTIFYQTGAGTEMREGRDPNKRSRRVRLGLSHALASAAIPFVFPAVQIEGICYADGALRQNTPLNPALRLGAERVLVVSLTPRPAVARRLARLGCRRNAYPGATFLLGRTITILMSQSLDYELGRVGMYNRLIDGGAELYGEGFVDSLNAILGEHRNATFRAVRTWHVRPSQSLTQLALEALHRAPGELRLGGALGGLVGRALASAALAEADLTGYLLFTPTFTSMLVDLGYEDARAQRSELTRLFDA
jgi:NTE family protein